MNAAAPALSTLALGRTAEVVAMPVPNLATRDATSRPPARKPLERGLVLALVLAGHAGLLTLTQLDWPRATPPEPPIEVALITPPMPLPPPPAPPVPQVRQPEPTPPKPKVKQRVAPQPAPAVKPTPVDEPVVSESPTALTTPEPPSAPTEAEAAPPPPAPAPPAPPAPEPVVAARFDADYLNNPAPAYPPLSRRMQEQGQVSLRVLVTADGQPGKIELHASSGSSRLDKAALDAVRRWRFVPARQGDRAVEAWVIVPIVFKLEGS